MLQNELFQEQVGQVLGNEFREGLRRNQGLRQTGSRSQGGQREGGQNGRNNSGDGSGDILGIPDMGILTSLKGMGAGMKNQLNQLALNFNNSNAAGNRGGGTRSSRLDEEARPLTAVDYEEEDDEEEDYSYSNTRGGKKNN
mmetsp:Transcript_20875/g.35182  ORF Transcript_20875/g.35182 Transcript_20875/m.35182 type:complete len:141 (-) Transcript_20875:195-617(-)